MKKLTKLNMKQKKVLIVGVIVLLVVVVVGGVLVFQPKFDKPSNNPMTTDGTIVQEVSPDEAESMYATLTEKCSGALVWNMQVGDSIKIDNLENTNACQNDNYFSKMLGYSYSSEGVTVYVNVLKNVNNQLFKLDDTLVGAYESEKINESLDYGTTYIYTYQKQENDYKLLKVELMTPVPAEVVASTETSEDDNTPLE